jgi:hypothetical protein
MGKIIFGDMKFDLAKYDVGFFASENDLLKLPVARAIWV